MTTESNALFRTKVVEHGKFEAFAQDCAAEGFELVTVAAAGAKAVFVVFRLAEAAGAAPAASQEASNVVAMPQNAQTDAAIAAVTTLPDGATVEVEQAAPAQQQVQQQAVMPGAGAAPVQQQAAPAQQPWVNPNTEESNAWRNVFQSHLANGVPADQVYNTLHADLSASTDPATASARLQSFGIYHNGMLN